jgi:hypothetical protein
MATLFALGVMSLGWTAPVAALIAAEKLLPRKEVASRGIAVLLAVLAVGVAIAPEDVPGLTTPGSPAAMEGMGMEPMEPMEPAIPMRMGAGPGPGPLPAVALTTSSPNSAAAAKSPALARSPAAAAHSAAGPPAPVDPMRTSWPTSTTREAIARRAVPLPPCRRASASPELVGDRVDRTLHQELALIGRQLLTHPRDDRPSRRVPF